LEGIRREEALLKLREDTIRWKEIDGETVLLDLRTSMYLSVNPSATLLWRMLAQGTTHDAMVDALAGEYGIGAEQAREDVDLFVADCATRDLIEDDGNS
jgi:hypothetical protein